MSRACATVKVDPSSAGSGERCMPRAWHVASRSASASARAVETASRSRPVNEWWSAPIRPLAAPGRPARSAPSARQLRSPARAPAPLATLSRLHRSAVTSCRRQSRRPAGPDCGAGGSTAQQSQSAGVTANNPQIVTAERARGHGRAGARRMRALRRGDRRRATAAAGISGSRRWGCAPRRTRRRRAPPRRARRRRHPDPPRRSPTPADRSRPCRPGRPGADRS